MLPLLFIGTGRSHGIEALTQSSFVYCRIVSLALLARWNDELRAGLMWRLPLNLRRKGRICMIRVGLVVKEPRVTALVELWNVNCMQVCATKWFLLTWCWNHRFILSCIAVKAAISVNVWARIFFGNLSTPLSGLARLLYFWSNVKWPVLQPPLSRIVNYSKQFRVIDPRSLNQVCITVRVVCAAIHLRGGNVFCGLRCLASIRISNPWLNYSPRERLNTFVVQSTLSVRGIRTLSFVLAVKIRLLHVCQKDFLLVLLCLIINYQRLHLTV